MFYVSACVQANPFSTWRDAKHYLIFSNEEAMVQDIKYLAPLGHSDHSCLVFNAIVSMAMPATKTERLNLNRGDYTALRNMLEEVNWDLFMDTNDVEESWAGITRELNIATANCVPLIPNKSKKNMFMDQDVVRPV